MAPGSPTGGCRRVVVLVTGGSGFIGSHLVDKLVEAGYDVRVFDRARPLREDVEWYRGDLLRLEDLLEACRDVEVIYHLAAVADVNVALADPELCLRVNELGTLNVLRAATASEVERLILASTSWVYGRATGVVTEETPIPPPDNIYTKTKIGQEHLVISWHAHMGLPYTILRYGIPYGPRLRSNMAIAVVVRRALRREPITDFGAGEEGRCCIYVEDLAEGNVSALKPQGKNQEFNIVGEEIITVNRIVEELRSIFGDLKVEHAPPRPGDFRGAVISIEKAREFLGWRPKIRFSEGLRRYVDWVLARSR